MPPTKDDSLFDVLKPLLFATVGALVIAFFWFYGIWKLFQQDRVFDAAAAFVIFPIGIIYGFLRFFGWL